MEYILPSIFRLADLNLGAIKMQNSHKSLWRPNVSIGGVYGAVPMATWCEALNESKYYSMGHIEYTVKLYNSLGAKVYFEFTNTSLSEKDLYDRWCNQLLKALCQGENGVIVSSHLLKEYIQEKYPQLEVLTKDENTGILWSGEERILLANTFCKSLPKNSLHTLQFQSPETSPSYYEETFFEMFPQYFIKVENIPPKQKRLVLEGATRPILDNVETYTYYFANEETRDFFRFLLLTNVYNDSTFEFERIRKE